MTDYQRNSDEEERESDEYMKEAELRNERY